MRVRGLEDVKVRVPGDGDALEDDERPRDEREEVGHAERVVEEDVVEVRGDGRELLAPLLHGGDVRRRARGEPRVLEDARQHGVERLLVDVRRQEVERHGVVDERGHRALDEVDDGLRERLALADVDLRAQPEVDQRQAAPGVHEQVARVRVAVVGAHVEHLPHEELDAQRHQPRDLRLRRAAELVAVDPVRRQHLAAPEPHGGDVHVASEAARRRERELRGHVLLVRRLLLVVELGPRAPREGLDERLVVGPLLRRQVKLRALHEARPLAEQGEVQGHGRDDVRALDLERDGPPLELDLVDLAQARGRDGRRRRVEPAEAHRADLRRDGRESCGGGNSWHGVAEAPQLVQRRGGHDVRPDAQRLAELDEGRPEGDERVAALDRARPQPRVALGPGFVARRRRVVRGEPAEHGRDGARDGAGPADRREGPRVPVGLDRGAVPAPRQVLLPRRLFAGVAEAQHRRRAAERRGADRAPRAMQHRCCWQRRGCPCARAEPTRLRDESMSWPERAPSSSTER